MTKAIMVYRAWRKQNKKKFRFNRILEEEYCEATDSLLTDLRLNNVQQHEIELMCNYLDARQRRIDMAQSSLIGAILGLVLNETLLIIEKFMSDSLTDIFAISWERIGSLFLVAIVGSIIGFCIGVITEPRMSQKDALNEVNFCKNVCLQYEKNNRIFNLRCGALVKVPSHCEFVYDEIMTNTEYYDRAFKISIFDHGHTYLYIWFSNKNYSKMTINAKRDFVKFCKKHVGKNWKNIHDQCIDFKQLEILEP